MAAAELNPEHETYVVHVGSVSFRYVAQLLPTRRLKFAAAELDPEHETYVVHIESVSSVASPSYSPLNVHRRLQIVGLIAKETPTNVPAEY